MLLLLDTEQSNREKNFGGGLTGVLRSAVVQGMRCITIILNRPSCLCIQYKHADTQTI